MDEQTAFALAEASLRSTILQHTYQRCPVPVSPEQYAIPVLTYNNTSAFDPVINNSVHLLQDNTIPRLSLSQLNSPPIVRQQLGTVPLSQCVVNEYPNISAHMLASPSPPLHQEGAWSHQCQQHVSEGNSQTRQIQTLEDSAVAALHVAVTAEHIDQQKKMAKTDSRASSNSEALGVGNILLRLLSLHKILGLSKQPEQDPPYSLSTAEAETSAPPLQDIRQYHTSTNARVDLRTEDIILYYFECNLRRVLHNTIVLFVMAFLFFFMCTLALITL